MAALRGYTARQQLLRLGSRHNGVQLCRYSSTSRDQHIHRSKVPTMHYQASLPRLPIPKLSNTCQRYLRALRPLVDNEQYEKTQAVVDEFGCEGGTGEMLQKKLVAIDQENKHTSYISGPWFDMYLEYREPLVLNHNPYIAFHDIPKLNNQLDRTANIIWSTVRFKQALKDSVLAPDIFHLQPKRSDVDWFKNIIRFVPSSLSWYGAYLMKAFPLDMSHYGSLFNSTRIPCIGKDELVTHTENTHHVVVFRRGHIYKMRCITDDGNPVSVAELKQGLQQILSDTRPPPEHPVGFLTTMRRDPWAEQRKEMLATNRASLETIDSALCVVCLEDQELTEPEAISRQMLYGDAANRWFDKSFSYIVTPSGRIALNFEHSWGDGVAVVRMINDVYSDNLNNPQLPSEESAVPCVVEKVEFALPDSTKAAIEQARKDYEAVTSSLGVELFQYHSFGKNLVKKSKLSPDSVMQLAFQVAYYRLFKCSPSTYESCSTAAFRHGRTETIRPASMATLACAEAFESAQPKELLELMREASNYHNELTKEAAMGQGFDRHLLALRILANKDNTQVPMFEDPSYLKMNKIILSTSTVGSSAVQLGGFAPVNPDCYGIGYSIFDEHLGCHVTTYPNCDGPAFIKELASTFEKLFEVLSTASN